MLQILRCLAKGAIRVQSAMSGSSYTISSATVRAGASSTLGSARILSSGAACRTAKIADQRNVGMWAPNARSICRGLSFATTARFSEPGADTTNDFSSLELSPERLKQLEGKPQQTRAAQDAVAAVMKLEDHPSRSLVQRLIADDAAWRSVHDEWQKLVEHKANWDDLAAMLASTNGADKVDERLRVVYGLTAGAAQAVTRCFREKTTEQKIAARRASPVAADANAESISAPGATVSRFVDWFGAHQLLKDFAADITKPLVVVGGIKTGKSMLMNDVLPGVIQAEYPNDRFVILPVDWSRLKDALSFAAVVTGFQDGIEAALYDVGLSTPPRVFGAHLLAPYLKQVEDLCLHAGYRPVHLWDEAPFLFSFDVPTSSPMYTALKPVLLAHARQSVYAMTGTASQMLLRVIADQPDNGSSPWLSTHRIVIPSAHPKHGDGVRAEQAADRALDLFFAEHPKRTVHCKVKEIKNARKDGDVIVPAFAVEVANKMMDFGNNLAEAVRQTEYKMDTEWKREALQSLYHMPVDVRKMLHKFATASTPMPLDMTLLPRQLQAVDKVLFCQEPASADANGLPLFKMMPSYARRIQAVLLPTGFLDPRALPTKTAEDHITLQIAMCCVLRESVPKTARDKTSHPIRPFLLAALDEHPTFRSTWLIGDPRQHDWFKKITTGRHNVALLRDFDKDTSNNTVQLPPETMAVYLVKFAGNFLVHSRSLRDEQVCIEGYMALEKSGVANYLFSAIERLRVAPDNVFSDV